MWSSGRQERSSGGCWFALTQVCFAWSSPKSSLLTTKASSYLRDLSMTWEGPGMGFPGVLGAAAALGAVTDFGAGFSLIVYEEMCFTTIPQLSIRDLSVIVIYLGFQCQNWLNCKFHKRKNQRVSFLAPSLIIASFQSNQQRLQCLFAFLIKKTLLNSVLHILQPC